MKTRSMSCGVLVALSVFSCVVRAQDYRTYARPYVNAGDLAVYVPRTIEL